MLSGNHRCGTWVHGLAEPVGSSWSSSSCRAGNAEPAEMTSCNHSVATEPARTSRSHDCGAFLLGDQRALATRSPSRPGHPANLVAILLLLSLRCQPSFARERPHAAD